MVYHAPSDWPRTVYDYNPHIDDVIGFYARSDWLKCVDEYYMKQTDSIFPYDCTLKPGSHERHNHNREQHTQTQYHTVYHLGVKKDKNF